MLVRWSLALKGFKACLIMFMNVCRYNRCHGDHLLLVIVGLYYIRCHGKLMLLDWAFNFYTLRFWKDCTEIKSVLPCHLVHNIKVVFIHSLLEIYDFKFS
jgi:hypothetical protein